jgi:hypothetical protein
MEAAFSKKNGCNVRSCGQFEGLGQGTRFIDVGVHASTYCPGEETCQDAESWSNPYLSVLWSTVADQGFITTKAL